MSFKALDLAVELYQECEKLKLKNPVRDQLLRASLSIALNRYRRKWENRFKRSKAFLLHSDGVNKRGSMPYQNY